MSHSHNLLEVLSTNPAIWIGFGVSFLASLAICLTVAHHHGWSGDDEQRIQKSHDHHFVPRIGGLAIFFSMIVLYILLERDHRVLFGPLVLASFPIFFVGLSEDIQRNVKPFHRLLVAFICGVFGWWITGYRLTHVGILGFDYFLEAFIFFSIAFTAFAITGLTHAHNMIDGVNGLSSGLAFMFSLGVSLIAYQVNDHDLWYAAISFAAIIFGFYIVNFPFGKLFLGDAGAYLCGFVVAWLAIFLTSRNSQVSEFSAFLLGIHPICEAIFSIVRRRVSQQSAMQPDAEHFHMLIKRKLLRVKLPGHQMLFYNSLAGCLILLMNIPTFLVAIFFYDNMSILLTVSAVYCLIFVGVSLSLEPKIFQNPQQRSSA
jgi:UDP-N-acetylmuramyl pentapeptide phosphotransferase/UDP-N-acetylglucosamine-1-phosphate transferase